MRNDEDSGTPEPMMIASSKSLTQAVKEYGPISFHISLRSVATCMTTTQLFVALLRPQGQLGQGQPCFLRQLCIALCGFCGCRAAVAVQRRAWNGHAMACICSAYVRVSWCHLHGYAMYTGLNLLSSFLE